MMSLLAYSASRPALREGFAQLSPAEIADIVEELTIEDSSYIATLAGLLEIEPNGPVQAKLLPDPVPCFRPHARAGNHLHWVARNDTEKEEVENEHRDEGQHTAGELADDKV
jgi:hypothetical protein